MDMSDNPIAGVLRAALEEQRRAYFAHPVPSLEERRADLRTLQRFIRENKDALCDAIFGGDACIYGDRHGRALLQAATCSITAARAGAIGVLKVAVTGFRKTHRATLPPVADLAPRHDRRALRAAKGIDSLDPTLRSATALAHDQPRDSVSKPFHDHPGQAKAYRNGVPSS
jgi:hypothetical protein